MALGIPCWNQGIPVEILESGFKISNSGILGKIPESRRQSCGSLVYSSLALPDPLRTGAYRLEIISAVLRL